eukprot:606710-Rhodomonas_salina.1
MEGGRHHTARRSCPLLVFVSGAAHSTRAGSGTSTTWVVVYWGPLGNGIQDRVVVLEPPYDGSVPGTTQPVVPHATSAVHRIHSRDHLIDKHLISIMTS